MNTIDSASAVPLYYQIAQLIRGRIELGELAPGDMLQPLREAAAHWQVNFHTVRHAYAELARAGLVESRGPRGTLVLAGTDEIPAKSPLHEYLDPFLSKILKAAAVEHGLSPAELIRHIASREQIAEPQRPSVYVLECSQHQCEDLSRQLEASWNVEAIPCCLEHEEDLPAENLIATHFHYNEIRLRWPRRLAEISFVSIAPTEKFRTTVKQQWVGKGLPQLTVCENDAPTAEAVAADISVLLAANEASINTRVIVGIEDLFTADGTELLLLPPRIWGSLTKAQRDNERLVEVRYVYDPAELGETAERLGWKTRLETVLYATGPS